MNVIYQSYLKNKEEQKIKDEQKKRREKEENEGKIRQVRIEMEINYSHDLEEKLEIFHHNLIKSMASNRVNDRNTIESDLIH